MNETKRKPIPKVVRQLVYEKYNGHCAYCGCEMEYKDMQVDHLIPIAPWQPYWEINQKDPNDIENLMPACRTCNHYKRADSLEAFRRKIETIPIKLGREYIYKVGVKYGFFDDSRRKVKFYFEKTTDEQARNTMQRLNRCFPGCFINERDEFIAHDYANQYFSLENVHNELDLKCKVLECLSRGCCKTEPYWNDEDNCEFHSFMLKGVNNFLGTNFTMQEMEVIYQFLGNSVRHDKTIEFVRSGYQMDVLHKDKATT